jgi:hypothetical protein
MTIGNWSLTDSIANLTIANGFPNKLTYQYRTDQLVTDRVVQTALISRTGQSKDTVRVSYTVQLFYRRGDP